jgi:hypothetical protein
MGALLGESHVTASSGRSLKPERFPAESAEEKNKPRISKRSSAFKTCLIGSTRRGALMALASQGRARRRKTQLKRASAVAWLRLYFFGGRQASEK